jgi:chorismate dehydratase
MEVPMYKFAVLPYCNAAPLVYFIPEFCSSVSAVEKYPSEISNELRSGIVDVALMPVVDFLLDDNLEMIPGLGICANGPVESVLLQSSKPLESIKSIRLFPESRTSNMLIKILISQYFGDHHNICFTSNSIDTDAYIVIGDKALTRNKSKYTFDLSEMWYERTSLPFVFAVWVYKTGCPDILIMESILKKAKEKGVLNIPFLSRIYAEKLRLSSSYIEHYLCDCLYYDIGEQEIESMKKFDELMNKMNGNKSSIRVRSISLNKKETNEGIRQLYPSRKSPGR